MRQATGKYDLISDFASTIKESQRQVMMQLEEVPHVTETVRAHKTK